MTLLGLGVALAAGLLGLPVLAVLGSWLGLDDQALATLGHQWQTVLPGYAVQSLVLSVCVAMGVTLMGAGAAACVTLFEFPWR